MRIARVKIQNFRCFNSADEWAVDWLPNQDLNLIIGPNGAGKTALVDAIDLVLNWEGRANRALVTEYDFPSCDSTKAIRIEITLAEMGTALAKFEDHIQFFDNEKFDSIDETAEMPDDQKHVRGVIIRFRAHFDEEEGEIRWKWVLPKLMETDYHETRELSRSQHEAIGYFRMQPSISAGAFTLGEYSTLGRHLRRLQYKLGKLPDTLKPTQSLPECNWDCESCADREACTNQIDNDTGKVPESQPLGKMLGSIAERASSMLGDGAWSGMKSSLGPRYAGLRTSLAATTFGLRPSVTEANGFIPFERLSTGEKYALSFALATTMLKESSSPIIIMEEPETALYPGAIGRIVAELQGADSPQVVVTSHSESVIRRFRLDDIFLMDAEPGPVPLAESVGDKDRLGAEALVAPGRTSALLTEKIIVAEGLEDTIVSRGIDRLANEVLAAGKGFARRGWCFFDAGGAPHSEAKAKLLRNWGKTVVILFDGDGVGQEHAATACKEFPTFAYTSSEVKEPALETALLNGLPKAQRERAKRAFWRDLDCQDCEHTLCNIEKCIDVKRCYSGLEKRERKRKLCDCCITEYRTAKQFPPAFSLLIEKLDTATPGSIVKLDVDCREA